MTTTIVKTTKRRQKPRRQQRRRNVTTVATTVNNRRPRQRRSNNKQPSMSRDGMAFLKCAYAAVDFGVGAARGIPDEYQGKSLTSDVSTSRAVGLTPATDTYIVVLPTPGISHWYAEVAVGAVLPKTTVFKPHYDKSFNGTINNSSLFGPETNQAAGLDVLSDDRTASVAKYRYVSNSIEITCTSSPVGTSGSIQVWHGTPNLNLGNEQVLVTNVSPTPVTWTEYNLGGLDFIKSVPRNHYTNHITKGAYVVATNNDQDFEFKPIISGITRVPAIGFSDINNPTFGQWLGDIVGMGDMNAMCIKLSSPAGSTNSVVIDTRSCIEYQPNSNSILDQYSGISAAYDPLAIQAYRQIAKQLPVAVPRDANDGFWDDIVYPNLVRFLKLAKTAGEYSGVVAGILGIVL